MRLTLIVLTALPTIVMAQEPVITSVVNAASYSATPFDVGYFTNPTFLPGLAQGSIASVFGSNLATTTLTAPSIPLPTSLGGASVSVNGIAASLFYVSPTQINFQMPSPWNKTPGASYTFGVVVTTAVGDSAAYPLGGGSDSVGLFTLDSTGCGRGAVLNAHSGGAVSLNSATDSISPGEFLSAYGTGLLMLIPQVPDGSPTPSAPLTFGDFGAEGVYDLQHDFDYTNAAWNGRAPGFIGVDQFNVRVPSWAREGCAVPFQVEVGDVNISQPVTIAIRKGGGPCVDPPTAGYGQITWERSVSTTSDHVATETDTATISLQASPGKQAPATPSWSDGDQFSGVVDYGPSCPNPGYRSLGAGTLAAQAPGLGSLNAGVQPITDGFISGLSVYRATLPQGTIQPGKFIISASGGPDVGAIQSSIQVGSGIRITTDLAGMALSCNKATTISWTGGDPTSWVTIRWSVHLGATDQYRGYHVRASDGKFDFPAPLPQVGNSCDTQSYPIEMLIEVTPDASQIVPFSAPGLSLSGQHTWKYSYRFQAFQQVPKP